MGYPATLEDETDILRRMLNGVPLKQLSPVTDRDEIMGIKTVCLKGKPKQDGTDQVMEGPAEKAPDLGKQIRKGAAACLKVLLLAGLLAGTVTVFIILRNYMRKRSYRSQNETDKLREQMRQALYFGKLCGEEMKPGETLEAYGRRCCRRLDTPDISFAGFCTLFEAVRFGGGTVSGNTGYRRKVCQNAGTPVSG